MTSPHTPTDLPHDDLTHEGYEKRDVDIRAILWLGASIMLTMLVGGLVVAGLMNYFRADIKSRDPIASPLADLDQVPPLPHLQASPNHEYREFRVEQEAALNSYGWIDKQAGVVRIPVGRAIDLLLERGLPTPTGSPEPAQSEK